MTAENIQQDYGDAKKQVVDVEAVDKAKELIDSFVCKGCGHSYDNPFPPLPDPDEVFH